MKRREFIAGLGSAATWPLTARAQQPGRLRRIVVVIGVDEDAEGRARVAAFKDSLRTLGWIEGHSAQFDIRFTGGNVARAREIASEMVRPPPDVILANTAAVVAAFQEQTRTTPIVFSQVVDPVGGGLVSSLKQPGGNITGFTSFDFSMIGKWLELLKSIAPRVTRVAVVRAPGSQTGPYGAIQALAPMLRVSVSPIDLNDADSLERGMERFAREENGGLIVPATPAATVHLNSIVALAARHRLPAIYPYRYFVTAGGLISYGVDNLDLFRHAASYVDRILKGEKVGDLPVQQPTKFELAINRKTASMLGLDVPETLLAQANEVIE